MYRDYYDVVEIFLFASSVLLFVSVNIMCYMLMASWRDLKRSRKDSENLAAELKALGYEGRSYVSKDTERADR